MHLLESIWKSIRFGMITYRISQLLSKVGIWVRLYYWYEEGSGASEVPVLKDDDEKYSFDFFGPEEMKQIASLLPSRREDVLMEQLNRGKLCFGAKKDGEIVAFTWIDLEESTFLGNKFPLGGDEAYLYDAVTLAPFRGRNLAPVVRYRACEVLREMGRCRFYSASERANLPAVKFKKKLGVRILWLGLNVILFKRFQWNWIIKRYQ